MRLAESTLDSGGRHPDTPSQAGPLLRSTDLQAALSVGHSILIIDDDTGIRRLLCRALESYGYTTVTAENGAEGVRRLVELKPCVIVLDFDMPVMDGHDFREVQKRVAPDVPIICITAATEGERVARRVAASSVHLKPFDVGALCDTIAELCRLPHTHRHTTEMEACIERERSARPARQLPAVRHQGR